MRIVERQNIDTDKWNAMVEATEGSTVFSYAWYLDACAENWCALLNDDYSKGLALPYSTRLGIETLYTPIFVRYIESLGSLTLSEEMKTMISDRFQRIQIQVKQPRIKWNQQKRVYQRIDLEDEVILGSQAKRSLKKAEKSGLTILEVEGPDRVEDVINEELKGKIKGLDLTSMEFFSVLVESARENEKLKVFEVHRDARVQGGVICIEAAGRLLYLKGAVKSDVKKLGGMYFALNHAIQYARRNGLMFDFGGSNVEGVRNVNYNLGGQDCVYYAYEMDKAPFWFGAIKSIRDRWKGK